MFYEISYSIALKLIVWSMDISIWGLDILPSLDFLSNFIQSMWSVLGDPYQQYFFYYLDRLGFTTAFQMILTTFSFKIMIKFTPFMNRFFK